MAVRGYAAVGPYPRRVTPAAPAEVGGPGHPPDVPADRRGLPVVLPLLATAVVGVLVAGQARINGEVSGLLVPPGASGPASVAGGLDAAILSFLVGWLLVMLATVGHGAGRRGLRSVAAGVRARRLPGWRLLGGVAGATMVGSQGVVVPALGVAAFTVAAVAGTIAGALLVDRLGVSPHGVRRITLPRLVATGLAVTAVVVAVGGTPESGPAAVAPLVLGLGVVVAMFAGVATAVQKAVNGSVALVAGTPWAAGAVNFTVGLLALVLVRLVVFGTAPPAPLPDPQQWWLYLSGPIGLTFIVVAAALVKRLGVLLLGLALTSGQLIGALLMDVLFPTAAGAPDLARGLGIALTLVAVTLASGLTSRRPVHSSTHGAVVRAALDRPRS